MFYTFGMKEVCKGINKFCNYDNVLLQTPCLRFSYATRLENISKFTHKINWDGSKIVAFSDLKHYASHYYKINKIKASENTICLQNRLEDGFFSQALQSLENLDSDLYQVINFIVKLIVVNTFKENIESTTQETIGLAVLHFKDDYTQNDFMELLVHQLAHMLLFIDNTIVPHMYETRYYDYPIETHSIKFVAGGTQFPAYIAFHSFIVACEVLLFRCKIVDATATYSRHGSISKIIQLCYRFYKALSQHKELFTPKANEIREKAYSLIEEKSSLVVERGA